MSLVGKRDSGACGMVGPSSFSAFFVVVALLVDIFRSLDLLDDFCFEVF